MRKLKLPERLAPLIVKMNLLGLEVVADEVPKLKFVIRTLKLNLPWIKDLDFKLQYYEIN